MNLAKTERAALCETLRSMSPDAPTLCEGWDAHSLAAHLWLRESGISRIAKAVVTRGDSMDAATAEVKAETPYLELVAKIEAGPSGASPFRVPGVDKAANLMEFFVHHEDLRRAGEHPLPPRVLSDEMESALWKALSSSKRLLFRKVPLGLIVATGAGQSFAVGKDFEATVVGRPSELVLYASGRTSAAQVEVKAEPTAARRLADSLGL